MTEKTQRRFPHSLLTLAGLAIFTVIFAAIFTVIFAVVSGGSVLAAELKPRPELLVSARWLADHLAEKGLRIVDIRDPDAYRQGHIPGAVNIPPGSLFIMANGVPGMMPTLDRVAVQFGEAGIGPDTPVVLYDDSSGLYAARLFWMLDYLGQGKGRMLDGNWPIWKSGGHPVSREIPKVPPATFVPRPLADKIADLEWMRGHLEDEATVYVDARSTFEYRGVTKYAKYRGHIPGAVSMEWKRHLKPDGTLRPRADLSREYRELGVTPEREIAVYCQVMVRASHSYFILKWLGYPRVRGYDGSWAEWGNRDDTPKEWF